MKHSCFVILFITFSIVEFAHQNEKSVKFQSLKESQNSTSEMAGVIGPIAGVIGAIVVWDCTCDKVCDLGEHLITPFIEMLSDFHGPVSGLVDLHSILDTILRMKTAIKKGYLKVKSKVIEFRDDVTETIADLVTEGSQIAKQYYLEVVVYRNRTNPLELLCETTRKYGFCKCSLKHEEAFQ